jgi:diguanylate cyclase (GGDEF)-like protein/PAS domain S-box-containing protein
MGQFQVEDLGMDRSPRRMVARVLGTVWVLEAALVLVARSIGGVQDTLGLVGCSTAAVVGVCFVLFERRFTNVTAQVATFVATGLVAYVAYYDGARYALLYYGSACLVAFTSTLRWTIAQAAVMLAAVAMLAELQLPGDQAGVLILLFAGTLVAVILVVVVLERRTQRSRAIFDAIFRNAPLAMALFDRDLRFVRVNETYAEWSGRPAREHRGLRVDDVFPGVGPQVEPSMREMLRTGASGEIEASTADGRTYKSSRYAIRDGRGRVALIAAIIQDVTDDEAARRQLALQASTDALTGLANRARFRERLELAIEHAGEHRQSVGVIFADLDGFKAVNDAHGHAAGDRLLEIAARRIAAAVRGRDIAARVGGDEFLVLVEGLEPAVAAETVGEVAARITEALGRPFTIPEGVVTVACSIGHALHPDDAASAEALLAAADARMYRAKAAGKAA